ncbi:MAG: UDP-N-acetylmuramate dehydrogenase [Ilumatobacteraceae bacterium]
MAPLTTYRVGGSAALFSTPRSYEDVELIGGVVHATGVPVLVLGRGSNLLVADEGYAGLVISTAGLGEHIDISEGSVAASAGVALPVLARRTAAAGLTGLEWMVGIPGSVGGAVRMNAGGHGSDVSASLLDVDLVDLATGARAITPASALGLRFRGSDLGDLQLVLRARFETMPGDRESCERELSEIVRWRREHQPGGQNAGSVFVNPVPGQVVSGELVERVGLRGHRLGTATVSPKHAYFIPADDGGRASDVRRLMELVRARVAEETGYQLRTEIRMVGFPDDEPGA